MANSNSILIELGIDKETAFTDPDEFARQVKRAADDILAYLGSSIPSSKARYMKVHDAALNNDPAKARAQEIYSSVIEILEAEDTAVSVQFKALMNSEFSRYVDARIDETAEQLLEDSILTEWPDKATAHAAYVELRKFFNSWVSLFEHTHIAQLPPKQGNFTNSGSHTFIVRHEFVLDDVQYKNPFTVINKLGLGQELKSTMDLMDYVAANPDCNVTVVASKVSQ